MPQARKEHGPKRARVAIRLLKLTIAFALLYWLLSSGRLHFHDLRGLVTRWPWLVLAQGLFALIVLFSALRWKLLLDCCSINYSLRDATAFTLVGVFFNQLLVGTTGGDLYRAYAVAKDFPERRTAGVFSVLVDRVIGLSILVAFVPIATLFNLHLVNQRAELAIYVVLTCLLLGAVVVPVLLVHFLDMRVARIFGWFSAIFPSEAPLQNIDSVIRVYTANHTAVAWSVIVSVAIQLLVVGTNACLALALFDVAPNWAEFMLLVPLAHTAIALPFNPPGALGTSEAVYDHLFRLTGISQGALLSVMQRLTYIIWAVVGAVIYVAWVRSTPTIEPQHWPKPETVA